MKNNNKTYEQLLNEIGKLSNRIVDLEKFKKFKNQLVNSEKKYRTLTENLNVGVYRNTPGAKGKFIEVNLALLKIFGYKNKKILPREKRVRSL